MSLTAPPTAPTTQDPTTFASRMDAFLAWMATHVSEETTLLATITALTTSTAVSFPQIFDSGTADADPGSGKLRLDNTTQNAATTVRTDLTGSDGTDWTNVLSLFTLSTSTVKGYLRIAKQTDATKFLIFSVLGMASPSGYRNITVSNVASSSASPFTNGDALIIEFGRTGDKGDTGATGSPGINGTNPQDLVNFAIGVI